MEDWATTLRLRMSSPLRPLTRSIIHLTTRIYTLVAFTTLSTFILLDLALWDYVASFPDGTMLPLAQNCSSPSPYCAINVKSLLMDPPDFYLHDPSSVRFVRYLDFQNIPFLSANTISIVHVLTALLASRLITSDSLAIRRLGVLLFQLRNFLDEVDGAVAKETRVVAGNSTLPRESEGTSPKLGYWVDGICDGLGSSFLFLGCYFYLQKHPGRASPALFSYAKLPLVASTKRDEDSSDPSNDTSAFNWIRTLLRILNRPGFIGIFFGWQTLISTTAWNRYILLYTELLEDNPEVSTTPAEHRVKAALIRSPVMWMIILAWRYTNPHTWIEILLMAIFFDRMGELLSAFRVRGFIVVIFVAGATEAHLRYTRLINF